MLLSYVNAANTCQSTGDVEAKAYSVYRVVLVAINFYVE